MAQADGSGRDVIERETFLAALELTKDVLRGLGLKESGGEALDRDIQTARRAASL
jgi:hypothetical protein